MFIKKLAGKKINRFLGNSGVLKGCLNLQEKQYLNKLIILCDYLFLFSLDTIKAYDEKVISFCFVFLIILHI